MKKISVATGQDRFTQGIGSAYRIWKRYRYKHRKPVDDRHSADDSAYGSSGYHSSGCLPLHPGSPQWESLSSGRTIKWHTWPVASRELAEQIGPSDKLCLTDLHHVLHSGCWYLSLNWSTGSRKRKSLLWEKKSWFMSILLIIRIY